MFRLDYPASPICEVCEVLKKQLEIEQVEKRRLLDALLVKPEQPKLEEVDYKDYKPVLPRHTPWSIQQAMFEKADREKAAQIKADLDRKSGTISVEELEAELLEVAKNNAAESGGQIFKEVKEHAS